MFKNGHKHSMRCRWCGKQYYAKQPVDRDGFDKPRCKQAHYRAYKKWVTSGGTIAAGTGSRARARK